MLSFSDMLAILPQQLVFGLTLGTAYGLIAIGYTMVYGVLFMINFAHGDVFMIGAYVGWALLGVLFDLARRADASALRAAAAAGRGDGGHRPARPAAGAASPIARSTSAARRGSVR